MYDDAAVIRAELDRLINAEDCNVIVVLYSYGGTIGTQAVHASLGARTRREQGLSGGVQSILYIAAAISPEGKSVLDMFGHNQPPFLVDKVCLALSSSPIFHLRQAVRGGWNAK